MELPFLELTGEISFFSIPGVGVFPRVEDSVELLDNRL
jgi:hypothetical protein